MKKVASGPVALGKSDHESKFMYDVDFLRGQIGIIRKQSKVF